MTSAFHSRLYTVTRKTCISVYFNNNNIWGLTSKTDKEKHKHKLMNIILKRLVTSAYSSRLYIVTRKTSILVYLIKMTFEDKNAHATSTKLPNLCTENLWNWENTYIFNHFHDFSFLNSWVTKINARILQIAGSDGHGKNITNGSSRANTVETLGVSSRLRSVRKPKLQPNDHGQTNKKAFNKHMNPTQCIFARSLRVYISGSRHTWREKND